MGNAHRDNLCEKRTRCNAESFRSMYEKYPPVDAPSDTVNGTNAVCANYTVCPSGHQVVEVGTDTEDLKCGPCPAGTYNDASKNMFQCRMCPTGTYAPNNGSVQCTACKTCPLAYEKPCTLTEDAVCLTSYNTSTKAWQEIPCPMGWNLDEDTRLCSMCATGYINISNACVKCPPNFYCPSMQTYETCQDLSLFERNGKFVYMPSSKEGSFHQSSCKCSEAGGFEGAAGLMGCTPCQDGYYASPGMTKCMPCPNGTYSTMQKGLKDFLKCPNATSPRLPLLVSLPATSLSDGCNTVNAGATSCTQCPLARPYTLQTGSTSMDKCVQCPSEYYMDAVTKRCTKCRDACKPYTEYEYAGCTQSTNRQCLACNRQCTSSDEYAIQDPGVCPGGKACAKCTNKPPNSYYLRGANGAECSWACNTGFYSEPALDASDTTCIPCTPYNSTTCPPGFKFKPCSNMPGRGDALCEEICNPDEYGKPQENSEWMLTTFNANQELIPSLDPRLPNMGCMWKCSKGYKLQRLELAGFSLCIPDSQ